ALRLRSLLAQAGGDASARRSDRRAATGCDAARHDRRPHVQHRHGRVQPGARRAPRQCRTGLLRQQRHRGEQAPNRQLRGRANEIRQLARGNAPAEPARGPRRQSAAMRFIHIYLIGYFILILGAGLALWQAGVLARISTIWIVISALIVVGLGIILAVTSSRTTTITRE